MATARSIGTNPRKIGLLVGAIVGAVACMLAANDRLAEYDMRVGMLGKMQFGPAAKINRAATLLTDRSGTAELLAIKALDENPLSSNAINVLAGAALLKGDPARADQAFRVAALFGWRDVPTQRYWLAVSLAANDYATAAQRADALLRSQRSPAPPVLQQVQMLEASALGRAALAEQMIANPPWLASYLFAAASLDGAAFDHRIEVIAEARRRGASFPSFAVSRLSWALVHRGAVVAAHRAWRALQGPVSGSYDVVERYGASNSSPFEWHIVSSGDVTTRVGHGPAVTAGDAVHIDYDGTGSRLVATRYVVRPPGSYTITWKATGTGYARIAPTMRCGADKNSILVTDMSSGGGNAAWRFDIPSSGDCTFATAQIEIRPSSADANAIDAWIGDITIHPISR